MRWERLAFIAMFVAVTVTPASAGLHDFFRDRVDAAESAAKAAVLVVVETVATKNSASPWAPSFFASVAAVALLFVTSDYVLIGFFDQGYVRTQHHADTLPQLAVLFVLSVVTLMGVPVWGARWLFLNSPRFAGRPIPYLTFSDALRSPWMWLPPILVVLYAYRY